MVDYSKWDKIVVSDDEEENDVNLKELILQDQEERLRRKYEGKLRRKNEEINCHKNEEKIYPENEEKIRLKNKERIRQENEERIHSENKGTIRSKSEETIRSEQEEIIRRMRFTGSLQECMAISKTLNKIEKVNPNHPALDSLRMRLESLVNEQEEIIEEIGGMKNVRDLMERKLKCEFDPPYFKLSPRDDDCRTPEAKKNTMKKIFEHMIKLNSWNASKLKMSGDCIFFHEKDFQNL